MKEINLEEILVKQLTETQCLIPYNSIFINAMKEACKQTLELAIDNAKIIITENDLIEDGSCYSTYDDGVITARIDRKSILDTINQIK